jgi:hypothetical protein
MSKSKHSKYPFFLNTETLASSRLSARPHVGQGVRVGLIGLVLLLFFAGSVLIAHEGDVTTFIMIGSVFQQGNPEGKYGYDGQFAYYIASDPSEAPGKIDDPAYRYQRILYPFLAWLISFGGKQSLLPWVMLMINILAVAVSIGLLGEILAERGVPPWHALAYLFSAGLLISLRADLNEPLAVLWALLGMILAYKKKWLLAGLSFALGILAKEIAVTFALGVVMWLFFERRFRVGLVLLATSLLPAILWGIFLTAWLGHSPLGADQAAMEIVPFYGLLFIGISPAKVVILLWVAVPAIVYGLVGTFDLFKGRDTLEVFVLLAGVALIAFMPRLTWYNAAEIGFLDWSVLGGFRAGHDSNDGLRPICQLDGLVSVAALPKLSPRL